MLEPTLTILPSPSCVLGATRTSSPSSPKTLLQTICFGFCILLAKTTSPEAQTPHQSQLQCCQYSSSVMYKRTYTDMSPCSCDVLEQKHVSSGIEGGQHTWSHALRAGASNCLLNSQLTGCVQKKNRTPHVLTTENSMQYSRTKYTKQPACSSVFALSAKSDKRTPTLYLCQI